MNLAPKRKSFIGKSIKNLQTRNNLFAPCRDKLSTCQLRIKMLAKQLQYVDAEVEKEEEAGNV